MKEFDANAPGNIHVKTFFEDKKCLIVSPFQNARVMVRKLLGNLGTKSDGIDMVNNYYEAVELFKLKKHQIIISEYKLDTRAEDDQISIEKKYGLDLLMEHKKEYPNRLSVIFAIISENKSQNVEYKCLDEEVEIFLTKPLSYTELEKSFLSICDKKIAPSLTEETTQKIKELISIEKFNEAFENLETLKESEGVSTETFYLEGLVNYKKGNLEQAAMALVQGSEGPEKHYKLSCLLFDVLFERREFEAAYDVMQNIVENFPLNPVRIPSFVKVAILNEHFSDLEHLCNVFLELEDRNPIVSKQIAAGLIVSSKIFIQNNKVEKAQEYLSKAIDFSCEDKNILQVSLGLLVEISGYTIIKKVITQIENDGRMDNDFLVIKLHLILFEEDFNQALTNGLGLINSGFKTPELYSICIESSINMGRKGSAIEEIIEDASNLYPEKRDFYQRFLKKVS